METTWDMSPAKRKMFIVAASFVVVRARPPGNYSAVFGAVFYFALARSRMKWQNRCGGVDAYLDWTDTRALAPVTGLTQSGRRSSSRFVSSVLQPLAGQPVLT